MSHEIQDNQSLFEDAPVPILREDWRGVKQALDQLKAQGVTDLDAYLDSRPDFIFEVRKLHRFVDANQQAVSLFGVADKATFLERASRFLPADPSSNIIVLRAFFEGATYAKGERTFRTRSGEVRSVIWRTAIPDTDDALERMHFYAVDITELKGAQDSMLTAQAQLAHAGRVQAVGELAASIAHEINQPLAAITTFSGAAARWLDGVSPNLERAREDLRKISINARRAAEIVRQIQGFMRKSPVRMQRHTPGTLAEDALSLVNWQAHRNNILTRAEIAPGLPMVEGDGVQIQQVLVNLMVNAIQAMSEVPAAAHELLVQVEPGRDGRSVRFKIRDTGPGVPTDEVERIFEPFVSSRDAGMGMGLAISRTILRAHDSTLRVENLEPEGAQFSFELTSTDG